MQEGGKQIGQIVFRKVEQTIFKIGGMLGIKKGLGLEAVNLQGGRLVDQENLD